MMNSQYIIFYISGLLMLLLIGLLIWYSLPKLRNRKKEQEALTYSEYPTACAGTPKGDEPREQKSYAIDYTNFQTKDGREINPDDYYIFIAKGNSMKFCHIYDGDLIFVAKGFRVVHLKVFPYILVLRRRDPKPGKSEYKIRRAWRVAKYNPQDQFDSEIRTIIASEEFQQVKKLRNENNKDAYRGDTAILEDFKKNRLSNYLTDYINCANPDPWDETVVISTTFDTEEEFIHFSIHPIATIVGIVEDSFTVDDEKQNSSNNMATD